MRYEDVNTSLLILTQNVRFCYTRPIIRFFRSFSICSVSGPFLPGCTARLGRFRSFLLGGGGEGREPALPPPGAVLGPNVHLGALRCRRTTGNQVPRATWFLWLSAESGSRDSGYLETRSPDANLTGNGVMKHCTALRLHQAPSRL